MKPAPGSTPDPHVQGTQSPHTQPETPWFPGLDAWFDRTFPMRRRRRISGWLGVLGAAVGYLYATATGAAVGGWVLGGAVAGFVSLVLAFFALKLLLAALILGGFALVMYLIYSALQ